MILRRVVDTGRVGDTAECGVKKKSSTCYGSKLRIDCYNPDTNCYNPDIGEYGGML